MQGAVSGGLERFISRSLFANVRVENGDRSIFLEVRNGTAVSACRDRLILGSSYLL